MALTLRANYWDDGQATKAFQDFMVEMFGLDFTTWRELGYWDDAYRPFSYFDGERVVANVCVYSLGMVVNGERVAGAQFSAVGTLPAHRRQGLNRQLNAAAEVWAQPRHSFIFLFADDEALPFYRRLGFTPAVESQPVLPVRGCRPEPGLYKLTVDNPDARTLIYDLAQRRTHVSDRLGALNPRLLMFHVLYMLRDHVYHVPALDVVVLCRRAAERLTIYDVVGPSMPDFGVLYPFLAAETDREVVFAFWPDRLGIDRGIGLRPLASNNLHLKGDFDTSQPVIFPFTSHA